jgi:cation diffusion facilitator family transporter
MERPRLSLIQEFFKIKQLIQYALEKVILQSILSCPKLIHMQAPPPPIVKVALFALLVTLGVMAIKFATYFLTNSTAVLSDALESIINVITGAFMLISVIISSRPADKSHPYGHGKIESFSAGLEGGLILLAAIIIAIEAAPRFFDPMPPQRLGIGILMLLGAGFVNLTLGLYLLRFGRRHGSDALIADGQHLLTDFYTSAGVILGLIGVRATGWNWLDPLVACLVAVNILIPGMRLVRISIRSLMNEADPEVLQRIAAALEQIKSPVWLAPHDLRVIRSGKYYHIDLHIHLPHYWTLSQAHKVEEEVAAALLETIGAEGDVMIHLDPCEPSKCSNCSLESCPERQHPFTEGGSITVEKITANNSK